MAILFNTARSRYPDITGNDSGEFAAKMQKSILSVLQAVGARVFQNSFIEDGTERVPGTSFAGSQISDIVAPAKRKILSQDIQPSLIIKKRMFSTLRENFDPDYFDEKEQLYIRATKTLFRKKCEDIAFYESLIYVNKIIEDPDFIYASNTLGNLFSILGNIAAGAVPTINLLGGLAISATFAQEYIGQTIRDAASSMPWLKQLLRISQVSEQAKQNKFTTWITDPLAGDSLGTGPGVGVMELTMLSAIRTSTSLSTGSGSCNITLQDPYRLSLILEADIDRALKEAYLENGRIPSYISERARQISDEAMRLDIELNASRRQRRVSSINFDFPFGTDTEVSATLVELNQSFTQSDLIYGTDIISSAHRVVSESLTNQNSSFSNIPEDQRFTATEEVRVRQIFNLLREYKVIQDRAIDEFQLLNNLNSDVLDRLRQDFVGHSIIQHMDSVHVFANSHTRNETPVYDSSMAQMIQNLTSSVMSREDTEARISDEFIDQERSELAPDIPLWIYKLMRNPHVFRGTGPQIWQGIVKDVSGDYQASTGEYTIEIVARDNLYFLELSSINTQPSVLQLQGALEDPLTPYEITVDPTTGLPESKKLLPENVRRLSANLYKFHDYPFLGKDVSLEEELYVDTSRSTLTGARTLRHVNGLLYRWKRGILSVTRNVNMSRPLAETFATPAELEQDYGLTVLNNIFAKLDSADILSILICGKPYNYHSFIRAALDSGSITLPNEGSTSAYFDHLFDIFAETNPTNGQFVPAISEIISREKATQAAQFEREVVKASGSMQALQRKAASILDKINEIKQSDSSPAIKEQLSQLEAEQEEINSSLSKLRAAVSKVGDIKIFGNEVFTHLDDTARADATKRTQYILLKKPEDVRYNRDGNFFVVSDKYSTDVAIQSFIQDLKDNQGFDPFENTYRQPIEIAKDVANVLHFELFADSQGNINFRPPEYNKMPLSLMLRLIQLGQTDGVSLVPPFIENLIKDRSKTYEDKLKVVELEIRERVALLGGLNKLNEYANGGDLGAGLQYVTTTFPTNDPKLVTYEINDAALRRANEASAAFTEGTQVNIVLEDSRNDVLNKDELIIEIMSVRNALRRLTGYPAEEYYADSIDQTLEISEELSKYTNVSANAASERLRLTNEISTRVSRRQTLINTIVRLRAQQSDISSAADFHGPGAMLGTFFSAMVRDTSSGFGDFLPKFLQDMIVNDLQNTIGRDSGKRFIIEDDVILSMSFAINAPEFTRVNVTGAENLLGQGGQAIVGDATAYWAGATDFDMWRQFGYRKGPEERVPYLNNAETQLAPYAVMLLMAQRGQIHTGSITIAGNEHYQVGETVYVAPKEMLYYITDVTHNISLQDNSFTTTLRLAYGRPLGQYIPHPFDIIGRTLLTDAARGGLNDRVNRAPPASASVKILETLHFPMNTQQAPQEDVANGSLQAFMRINAAKIRNAIIKAHSAIHSSGGGTAKLEIRGFVVEDISKLAGRSSNGLPVITSSADTITEYMWAVRTMMTTGIYPESLLQFTDNIEMIVTDVNERSGEAPQRIEEKYFKEGSYPGKIVIIDRPMSDDDIKYRRMPSQKAWSASGLDSAGNALVLPTNALDIALIIDRSVAGDSVGEQRQGDHVLPSSIQKGNLDATGIVSDDDKGQVLV